MLFKKEKLKKTNRLINLTDTIISAYEIDTGEIRSFRPLRCTLSTMTMKDHEDAYFVVDDQRAADELYARFGLENVAIVQNRSCGRGGCIIVNLKWARDPEYRVKLCHRYAKSA